MRRFALTLMLVTLVLALMPAGGLRAAGGCTPQLETADICALPLAASARAAALNEPGGACTELILAETAPRPLPCRHSPQDAAQAALTGGPPLAAPWRPPRARS